MNETKFLIENMAGRAGWDSYTLMLLICRWADEQGLARSLIDFLEDLASQEEDFDGPDSHTGFQHSRLLPRPVPPNAVSRAHSF